jgi:Fic-DOC domain mobile mystery protein B
VGVKDPDGATPLTETERFGLRQSVPVRADLNNAEAANIGVALGWVNSLRLTPEMIADEAWLKELHRRMYNRVWEWAGQYRAADRNIGVPHWQVRVAMRDTEADTRAWLADTSRSRMGNDEIAVRLGWRLVAIHPFPNGNGRWSRLVSDRMSVALGGSRFTWGGVSLTSPGALRRIYIDALQIADVNGDLCPLIAFARS